MSIRSLSRIGAAIASIADVRNDKPIIIVCAAPIGDPKALTDAVREMASGMGYEPWTSYLEGFDLADVARGVRAGASYAMPSKPDAFHILDTRSTADGEFTRGGSEVVMLEVIERINEAPLGRSPIVAIIPDMGDDDLARVTRLVHDRVPGAGDKILSIDMRA